jgi:modification methylase
MLPAIAATAITRYTRPGDLVIDPMCGIGTTLIEAVHLGRDAAGVEYEPRWAQLAAAGWAALVVTSPPYGRSVHG